MVVVSSRVDSVHASGSARARVAPQPMRRRPMADDDDANDRGGATQ